jgi:hypothetical protein
MPIVEGITATKAAFEVSKIALDLLRNPKINVAAVQERLLELQGLILSAQQCLGTAEDNNRTLKREYDSLVQQQQNSHSLTFADDAYWRRDAQNKLDGPYCPTCWDDAKKMIRLKYESEGLYVGHDGKRKRYDCVLHKTTHFIRAEIWTKNELIS